MSSYDTPVFLPAEVLEALGEHTGRFWRDPLLEPVICDAIRAWIKPAPAAPAQQPQAAFEAGYQWKQVFLPQGTKLRASFGGQPWFAVVEGAQITYDGVSISPSRFANLQGSGNRNAWKAIWLRLPGSEEWLLADVCRSVRQNAIARMFEGDAPTAKPKQRAASRTRQTKGKDRNKQPAPARARATGKDDSKRAAVPKQGAARLSAPSKTKARPYRSSPS